MSRLATAILPAALRQVTLRRLGPPRCIASLLSALESARSDVAPLAPGYASTRNAGCPPGAPLARDRFNRVGTSLPRRMHFLAKRPRSGGAGRGSPAVRPRPD